jgi:ATP-dependent Lon protease
VPGNGGGLTLTGQLGEVMKESAMAARSTLVARRRIRNRTERDKNNGVHLHVPAGAIPKDRSERGRDDGFGSRVALYWSKVRSDTAMTGEITLFGFVVSGRRN